MTAHDEFSIQAAEIRQQYNLMMELKERMNKEKKILDLQIRENYVHLVNRKKSLYQKWMFGLVDFSKGIKMVNSYIQKLKRKEIRRNEKCEEKSYYDIMKEHIESETGIKVKSIDEIVIYGYEFYYTIYFTDAKYGKTLAWRIPNLRHERYCPKMYYAIEWGKDTTPDFETLLDDLEMKLYLVKDKTESFIDLDLITSFPTNISKHDDFGKRLDERFSE